jgi:ankyrin repeat protein
MEATFLDACGADDLFTVISLLTSSPALAKWQDPVKGTTGLTVAAYSGSLRVLQFLLSLQTNGPDVNARDVNGGTALLAALASSQFSASSMLLADPRVDSMISSRSGMTPMMLACRLNAREIVATLLEKVSRDHVVGAKDGPGQTARTSWVEH